MTILYTYMYIHYIIVHVIVSTNSKATNSNSNDYNDSMRLILISNHYLSKVIVTCLMDTVSLFLPNYYTIVYLVVVLYYTTKYKEMYNN